MLQNEHHGFLLLVENGLSSSSAVQVQSHCKHRMAVSDDLNFDGGCASAVTGVPEVTEGICGATGAPEVSERICGATGAPEVSDAIRGGDPIGHRIQKGPSRCFL